MKRPVTRPPPLSRTAARSRASTLACVLLAALASMGPAGARPLAAKLEPGRAEADRIGDLKARGDKARASAEARERRWDRKMKAVSGSVCIGC